MRASWDAAAAPSAWARSRALAGLYVHVPFCAKRCSYCDFSTGVMSAHAVERYLAAMEMEIELRAEGAADLEFSSVFFGGGTPSALPAEAFTRLWAMLRRRLRVAADAEITLEANPESVGLGRLATWRAAGVNRLSMGAQSFHADELELLGRIHDAERPAAAFALARRFGFERLSLDLMFGFPGHTLPRWRATLERALALEPEHLSAYCYIPESGTSLGDASLSGSAALPSPELQARQYHAATARLASAGYDCYETSNFARPRAEARHNLVYWLVRPYLGLGPAAHGFMQGVRYGNHYAFSRWATALERGRSVEAEREEQTWAARASEVLMLGLRLGSGLDRADHPAATWDSLQARYGAALDRAVTVGRLERTGGGYRVPAGLRFLADDVVAWIEARAARVPVDEACGALLT